DNSVTITFVGETDEFPTKDLLSVFHIKLPELFKELSTAQREDEQLKEIIDKLEKKQNIKNFILKNNKLVFKMNNKFRYAVPERLKELIFRYFHESEFR
ncbi:hypothetical protein, partial [Klebsiella pneumoniae]|uniref:hypothetical protein n=1 Tax=Klebsiella pneumoniae TaxID=573 RepID=UPI0040559C21